MAKTNQSSVPAFGMKDKLGSINEQIQNIAQNKDTL